MFIQGKFRDVLKRNEEVIEDRGWKSNKIVPDFGNFLAAVMKKEFKKDIKDEKNVSIGVGIEYIAVGCGSNDPDVFKTRVGEFFKNVKSDEQNKPYRYDGNPDNWVWVKRIDNSDIEYVSGESNKLQINVTFDNDNPIAAQSLKFEELALLGYHDLGTATDPEKKLFFINYATHGTITKEKDMVVTRTINLTFPILPQA